jgi:hypothetical protein
MVEFRASRGKGEAQFYSSKNGYAVLVLTGFLVYGKSTVYGSTPYSEAPHSVYILEESAEGKLVPYTADPSFSNGAVRPETAGGIYHYQTPDDVQGIVETVRGFPEQPNAGKANMARLNGQDIANLALCIYNETIAAVPGDERTAFDWEGPKLSSPHRRSNNGSGPALGI